METPFNLYLLSPEQHFEHEARIVMQLLNLGLEAYHLRKPGWSLEETRSFMASLSNEFHHKVVLHSHFNLGEEFNIKGIHLNENNKKLISEVKDIRIISASFHGIADIKKNLFPFEYAFLSPIFDSISKVGYNSNFDLKMLALDLSALNKQNQLPKIIALGGINAQNIHLVGEMGFAGAALLGAVWQSENPVKAFLEIQSTINATS
jgi:thiamine-phosphate pyrophosphorylase